MFFAKAKEVFLDIFFPPLCINCQKYLNRGSSFSICADCFSQIRINNTFFCPICRNRLAENKKTCHPQADYFLAAAGNYNDIILQDLIHHFKYKNLKGLAPILGDLLTKYLQILFRNLDLEIRNFIITPIPLNRRRERERGFNQAKLLAQTISKNFNLALVEALKRIKNTKSQANTKDHEERSKNIAGCFTVISPALIQNKNIILIDDVFTSGATINEAVRILKSNGAKKIITLVLAKT